MHVLRIHRGFSADMRGKRHYTIRTGLFTMILVVAATEFEMAPIHQAVGDQEIESLICGVGVLESCLRLSRYLEKRHTGITQVILFGVGGAYLNSPEKTPNLLDVCLAEQEIFGDLGICFPRRFDELSEELSLQKRFELDCGLLSRACRIFDQQETKYFRGNFITVSCVSGTAERGEMLRHKYAGLCENMEGAAIARVCREFSIPMLELRCISNFVEDRNPAGWRLHEACTRAARMAAMVANRIG